MVYGAGRQRISAMLAPLTARIPLGGIADEAAIIATGWAINKWGKPRGFFKDVIRDALTIENARLGEAGAQMAMGGNGGTKQSTNMVVYG